MAKTVKNQKAQEAPAVENKKRSSRKAKAQEMPAVEQAQPQMEEQAQVPAQEAAEQPAKLIVVKRTVNDRWYVYYKGVAPEENVGCGCKTAASAIRYMMLLKRRDNATISEEAMNTLTSARTFEQELTAQEA